MKEFQLVEYPQVSIVVPMFNAERFVAQTLDSLVKQTFKNIEIIVVNDGSTDGSKRVVDHFSFDRRLRYFEKPNGGTGSALNYGHEKARGEYITWCSADNIYLPAFVETLRSFITDEVQLVYSDFCFMNEQGQKIRDVLHEKPQSGKDLIEGYDIGMSFMYTKNLWNKTGPFWDRICEDYEWITRARKYTSFGLVKAVLAAFRVHGGQITGSRQAEEKAAADHCKRLAMELYGDAG